MLSRALQRLIFATPRACLGAELCSSPRTSTGPPGSHQWHAVGTICCLLQVARLKLLLLQLLCLS
jgi:hypothetical protein